MLRRKILHKPVLKKTQQTSALASREGRLPAHMGIPGTVAATSYGRGLKKTHIPLLIRDLYQVENPARSKPYNRYIPLYGILLTG